MSKLMNQYYIIIIILLNTGLFFQFLYSFISI